MSLFDESPTDPSSKSSPPLDELFAVHRNTAFTHLTASGRRHYLNPETLSQSDGKSTKRACLVCGLVRRGKAPTCRACYNKIRADRWVDLNCDQCGSKFQKLAVEHEKLVRRGRTARFCTQKCHGDSMRSPGCPCLHCGKPTGSKDRGRKYCSAECREVNKKPRKLQDRACPMCGTAFRPKSHLTQYCTRSCADGAHSIRMIGKGNSHYKDGTSYAEWFRLMRPLILERDGDQCRACGLQNVVSSWGTRKGKPFIRTNIVVHHINEKRWENQPENLIALCQPCHMKHHKSKTTPFPWFATYAENATLSMTSKWQEIATSLLETYSSTTASSSTTS